MVDNTTSYNHTKYTPVNRQTLMDDQKKQIKKYELYPCRTSNSHCCQYNQFLSHIDKTHVLAIVITLMSYIVTKPMSYLH